MINFSEQEFKNRLTAIINEYNGGYKTLAHDLHIYITTVNRWLNQKAIPKTNILAKLSIITQTSLDFIILGQNKKIINYNNISFDEIKYKSRLLEIFNTEFNDNIDISKSLGMNNASISLWKTNKREPSIYSLAKLSLITDISLDFIILGIK